MKFEAEEILMVIIAFIIGWFLSTMISSNKNTNVKSTSGKHSPHNRPCCGTDSAYRCQDQNRYCNTNAEDIGDCGGNPMLTGRCDLKSR